MSDIKINKRMYFPVPNPGDRAWCAAVNYVSNDRNVLMDTISIGSFADSDGRGIVRRSEDNGRTWTVLEEHNTHEQVEKDLVNVTTLPIVVHCDPQSGRLLRMSHTLQEKPSVYPWIYAVSPVMRTYKPYIQISSDQGTSWTDPEPIIVSGDQYDGTHWMPGIWHGKNSGMLCCQGRAVTARDGRIIAPCFSARLFQNGDIIDPDAVPESTSPDGPIVLECSCLLGAHNDAGGIDWTAGEKVSLPKAYSCDGGDEPCVAHLPDDRLFMGIRARTFPHTGQTLPSLHYYAISHDDGLTWETPRPLVYDDDSFAYSPSCFINVLLSNKNGRFYVITNFADRPCVNCDPRHKLYIAEIDCDTFRVKKDTMTIIDQRDEANNIRFSNWRYFEDRETGDLVLFMNPACPEAVKLGEDAVPHIYRYDIQLPG